jgi:hypothetical protein
MVNFVSNNIPQNTDQSSYSNLARDDFHAKHADQLGEKHKVTIKNLKDLQSVEQYMFKNLRDLNKSSPSAAADTETIKTRLNELSAMRMALFTQLKNMYQTAQTETSNSRSNLADQITMTNVVDNELDNATKELEALKQERLNKKRLVELGEYEYDRYTSHKNIFKVIAYGALGVLLITLLMGQPWFPSIIGIGCICLIIAVVIITIMGRLANNFSRNNLFWDKFDYTGVPSTGRSKERKGWDWGSMFSDTCKNIETSLTSAKDSLVKAGEDVSNRAEAAGKISATVSTEQTSDSEADQGGDRRAGESIAEYTARKEKEKEEAGEGFRNRVYASQPKGHEHFHTIF